MISVLTELERMLSFVNHISNILSIPGITGGTKADIRLNN